MKKIFFALLVFLPALLQAQPKQGQALIDSLVKELNSDSHKNAEDKITDDILVDLCFDYYDVDPDKGIGYGKQGLALAEKLNLKNEIAQVNYYLGTNFCVKADYPTALEYYLKALKLNEELGNKKRIANTLNNIGRVFVMQKNCSRALEYYTKSLSVLEELKDTIAVTNTLGSIGSAYEVQKDYPKALEYYNRALAENIKLGDKNGIADNTGNIGLVFMDQHDYNNALQYFFEALKMNERLEDKNSTLINIGNIGECYLAIATDTTRKIRPGGLIPSGKTANLQKAIEYLKKCIALCKEVGDLGSLQTFTKDLSEAEELLGNYKSALGDYKLFVTTKDSVFNIDNNVKITNLETKRDLDLKDKQIEINNKQIEIDKLAVAKKDTQRWFFIAGIVALMMIIFITLRNNQKQKHSNHLLSKEKQKSEHLLLNILPAEVAEELKEKGTAHAKYYDNVTVLFTDFVDFTKAGEHMKPEELISELDACFKAFDEITGKYDIEKIKTIGDAYLAVAGLPTADPKHAENAVRAAIEINAFMADRQTKLGNKTFGIRIGIHSGSVVAGIVGLKKFAYDIWGDTVNTAARMEEHSEAGRINISHSTYELVKDEFSCEYRGEIDAKGKGMLQMYYVAQGVASV